MKFSVKKEREKKKCKLADASMIAAEIWAIESLGDCKQIEISDQINERIVRFHFFCNNSNFFIYLFC